MRGGKRRKAKARKITESVPTAPLSYIVCGRSGGKIEFLFVLRKKKVTEKSQVKATNATVHTVASNV